MNKRNVPCVNSSHPTTSSTTNALVGSSASVGKPSRSPMTRVRRLLIPRPEQRHDYPEFKALFAAIRDAFGGFACERRMIVSDGAYIARGDAVRDQGRLRARW